MTIIDNQISGSSISKYTYIYDALGRRHDRTQSGSAVNTAGTDTFSYNDRSEVISSNNSVETAAEWNPTYTYDKIGNRKRSSGITDATYSVNALNQYDAISAPSAVNPAYDSDGNLISDGGNWTYTWNSENRLRSATDGITTLNFTYDYQGRLVKKDDDADIEVYIYDGWNRIFAISNPESQIETTTSFLWGLDLSVTMQGAGGVGGLLKEGSLYPTYDANGNVMQKLDGNGATVMNVAYDPFGTIISGTLVGEYGFSTKPFINGPDWYYYGFRYYDPVTGRWPSRDPIGERGGINLYGMVGNDSINRLDLLGLKIVPFLLIEVYRVEISAIGIAGSTGSKIADLIIELVTTTNDAISIRNAFRTLITIKPTFQSVPECYILINKQTRKERSNYEPLVNSAIDWGVAYRLEVITESIYGPKEGFDENCCPTN